MLEAIKKEFLKTHTFSYVEQHIEHSFTWHNCWKFDGQSLSELLTACAHVRHRDVPFLKAVTQEFLRKKHAASPHMNWAGFDYMGFKPIDFAASLRALAILDFVNYPMMVNVS